MANDPRYLKFRRVPQDLMASVIVNMETIQENNDTMLQGVNEFLNDISEKVSGVLGIADQVKVLVF